MSHLRVLRFLRLLRVLRLLRLMHFIGELNMIISSVSQSLRSLCWTGLLLAMMMYIVGVMFTQITVGYKLGMYEDPTDAGMARLSMHWGSLARSILSLYAAILGGIDWDDLATPLSEHVSPLMAVLFCFYIGFSLIAVMNVITGVFVETSMKQTEMAKELDFMRVAHEFFDSCDEDGSGTISFREFDEQIETPSFKAYCESLGIDTCDAKLLFTLLDSDGSGELEAQELFHGMLRLRSGAKYIDIQKLVHMTDTLSKVCQNWSCAFERQISAIRLRMDRLESFQPPPNPPATPPLLGTPTGRVYSGMLPVMMDES
eukprot:CAMPEP_0172893292 /NCGR_PEP_ID=MMETSP1075-20121228/148162_1 /TAXON_ID=2916 /ORGANISM="Ceratium fusus, Strain PA161109" /LENGTH=314 /DNA_ID=CAMNT_0013748133 /DNA_START=202 /DNA_END=1143 /DNA_ORIENTATION=-